MNTEKLKPVKESSIKDIYVLHPNLDTTGLLVTLDGYKVKEEKVIRSIREVYKETKDFKLKEEFNNSRPDASPIVVLAIGFMMIELTTIPLRLIPDKRTRIKHEIQKQITEKLTVLSTDGISLHIEDENFQISSSFKNNQIFIPLQKLNLHSENMKKIPYKLYNSQEELILSGEFNFSEAIHGNTELRRIVEKNSMLHKKKNCFQEYPILVEQDFSYEQKLEKAKENCQVFVELEDEFGNKKDISEIPCLRNFETCYYLTID